MLLYAGPLCRVFMLMLYAGLYASFMLTRVRPGFMPVWLGLGPSNFQDGSGQELPESAGGMGGSPV